MSEARIAPPFAFGAAELAHGHIYGMCQGLVDAGARLQWVYDPDPRKVDAFRRVFPQARIARCLDELLADPDVRLVAAAAVPDARCALGLRAMDAGKDYFTDKAPFTSLDQLGLAVKKTAETGLKYWVYYGERLHVESAVYAETLIAQGAIGRVLQVIGLGPHRLNAASRPPWFFQKARYGGILCDIGSHQIEQFLAFSGARDARIQYARVANHCHPEYPELEDFGECALFGDNGASNSFRVDWLTPDGLGTWGDGRAIILGTEGYIELRKYVDVARDPAGDQVYLVDASGERHFSVAGQIGFPFFGRMIRDCLDRTETAMTQAHAFKAAELCLLAQRRADEARA